ncbi:MAG: hypothetical protein ACRCTA_05360, partial [Bacilli bacterium]
LETDFAYLEDSFNFSDRNGIIMDELSVILLESSTLLQSLTLELNDYQVGEVELSNEAILSAIKDKVVYFLSNIMSKLKDSISYFFKKIRTALGSIKNKIIRDKDKSKKEETNVTTPTVKPYQGTKSVNLYFSTEDVKYLNNKGFNLLGCETELAKNYADYTAVVNIDDVKVSNHEVKSYNINKDNILVEILHDLFYVLKICNYNSNYFNFNPTMSTDAKTSIDKSYSEVEESFKTGKPKLDVKSLSSLGITRTSLKDDKHNLKDVEMLIKKKQHKVNVEFKEIEVYINELYKSRYFIYDSYNFFEELDGIGSKIYILIKNIQSNIDELKKKSNESLLTNIEQQDLTIKYVINEVSEMMKVMMVFGEKVSMRIEFMDGLGIRIYRDMEALDALYSEHE